jgi:hypothetical protein
MGQWKKHFILFLESSIQGASIVSTFFLVVGSMPKKKKKKKGLVRHPQLITT